MNPRIEDLELEVEQLRTELATLQLRLGTSQGDNGRLRRQIRLTQEQLQKADGQIMYFKRQAMNLLAEVRALRDELNNNPYPDEFYNEN